MAPDFSAASIIESPMRSLIEPPGFWLSSFRKSSQEPVSNVCSLTSGVLPISPRTPRVGGGGTLGDTGWVILPRFAPRPARDLAKGRRHVRGQRTSAPTYRRYPAWRALLGATRRASSALGARRGIRPRPSFRPAQTAGAPVRTGERAPGLRQARD